MHRDGDRSQRARRRRCPIVVGLCAAFALGCPQGGGGEGAPPVASVQTTAVESGLPAFFTESSTGAVDVVVYWGGLSDVATSLTATRLDLPSSARPPIALELQPAGAVATDGRFVAYLYLDGNFISLPPIRARVFDMQGTSGGSPYPLEDWSPFPGDEEIFEDLELADGWLAWIAAPDASLAAFEFGLSDLESGTSVPVRTFGPANGRAADIALSAEVVAWADTTRIFVLPFPFETGVPLEVGERSTSPTVFPLRADESWVFWQDGDEVMAFDSLRPLDPGLNPVSIGPAASGPTRIVDVAFGRVLLLENRFLVVALGDPPSVPEVVLPGVGGDVVLGDGWLLATGCGAPGTAVAGEPPCAFDVVAPETVVFAVDLSQPVAVRSPSAIASGLRLVRLEASAVSPLGFAWREIDLDGLDYVWFFNPSQPVVPNVNPVRVASGEFIEGGPTLTTSGLVYVERDPGDATYAVRYVDAASLLVATTATSP